MAQQEERTSVSDAPPPAETAGFAHQWFFNRWTAVLLAALLYAGVNARWWNRAWDDMAITLGFARTFAETGMIAPTPYSAPVEGTSSLLWMFLNAALYLFHHSPDVLFAQAKVLGIAFLLLDVGIVFAVAVACGVSRPLAFITSLVFAGSFPAIIESVNGMENPMYIFLYCVAFISYFQMLEKKYFAIFLLTSCAILFVRWESIWFLVPFALINWWRFGIRGFFAIQHWIWFVLFAGMAAWRFAVFGDIVPNTVRAKGHPPYSPGFSGDVAELTVTYTDKVAEVLAQINPFLFLAVGAAVIALAFMAFRAWKATPPPRQFAKAMPWTIRLSIAIVVAGGIFAAATWGNWGYRGRMFFIALPFLLVTLAWSFERLARANRFPVFATNAIAVVAGAAAVTYGMRMAQAYLDSYGPTVADIARILPAVESAKRLTGLSRLTLAHPDLGGLLLYGDGIRIIDTALLCNGPMARQGYDAFPTEIFERERPDVIQTHGTWTRHTGIAQDEAFYKDYAPIFLDGVRLFMRRDLLAKIPADQRERRAFSANGGTDAYDQSLLWSRHSSKTDFAINRRFGYYWVPVGTGQNG